MSADQLQAARSQRKPGGTQWAERLTDVAQAIDRLEAHGLRGKRGVMRTWSDSALLRNRHALLNQIARLKSWEQAAAEEIARRQQEAGAENRRHA